MESANQCISPDPRMSGMRILFLGVNDARKDFVWDIAAKCNMEAYAIGSRPEHEMVSKVKKYILYEAGHRSNDCDVLVERIRTEIGDVDGCLCLWDSEVPWAALVTSRLGKPGISQRNALTAKSKLRTLQTIWNGGNVARYASRCLTIQNASDVDECVGKVGLPAVMKTEFGGGAMGIRSVHNTQEAVSHFQHIQALYDQHRDRAYMLGGDNKSCVLMEFLEGSEHCVDLAIFHGELVCAFVCDKGPQIPPDVFKTVLTMPSLLPDDKLESVVTAAFHCCRALGLGHGVFDVDIMLTSSGPKLIEINPRMGGYCQREFILQCYSVDLVHLACMVACNIKPNCDSPDGVESTPGNFAVFPSRTSRASQSSDVDGEDQYQLTPSALHAVPSKLSHVVGMFCYPWRHAKPLKSTAKPDVLQRLHDDHQLLFIPFDKQLREYEHEIPYCAVAVKADTFGKARDGLIDVCGRIGLEADDVSLKALLDYFTENNEN